MRSVSVLFFVLLGVLFDPQPAVAQLDLPGAGSGTFSVVTGGRSITFDVAESELGANWATTSHNTARHDCNTLPADEQRACMEANSFRNKWFVQARAAIAAQQGKRTIFSRGDLTPGFESGVVFGWDFEHATGATSPYAGAVFGTREIKTIAEPGGSASGLELVSEVEKAGGVLFGVNHYFREDFVIGGSYEGSWNRTTPGDQQALQVCEVTQTGVTASGSTIRSEECDERFPGPLTDDYLQHIRFDILKTFGRVDDESLGIVGGISTEHRTHANRTWNLSIGPVLHPKGRPYQTLLAILVTFTDFTDANNGDKKFTDIFGIGLRLGIPLTGF